MQVCGGGGGERVVLGVSLASAPLYTLQALIISLLVFNMVSRMKPVDDYSQYVASLVIRVTELVMPVWFCCSLWNYKK